MIKLASYLTTATQHLVEQVRQFYYWVMLLGHRCPKCGQSLTMVSEGRCRCGACGYELDPTVAFQRCPGCGGVPKLRIRRYQCRQCGRDMVSRFLFDGLVFDRNYFRTKMLESRQRKKELRERVKQMLAESRSGVLLLEQADLHTLPGLVDALDALTADCDGMPAKVPGGDFDLRQYEDHIRAHIHDYPLNLRDLPALHEDDRRDLIWRFIAVIFLAHTGVVDIWQEGRDVMVMKHEANREGQRVHCQLQYMLTMSTEVL